MLILIMGTPIASGNRGVFALGASIVDLCLGAAPEAEIRFLQVHKPSADVQVRTRHGIRSVPLITCRMSFRSAIREHLFWILIVSVVYRFFPSKRVQKIIRFHTPWVETVAAADIVGDVRGGDSFSDIYGLRRFFLAFLPVLSVILVKGHVVHFPQTYGPFRTRTARYLAKFILRSSSVVIARDCESQRIAQALVGSRLKIQLSPDVAFSLYSETPARLLTNPPFAGKMPVGTIGLNVNGLMFNGGYHGGNMFGLTLDYREFLRALISSLLLNSTADLLLVPHTFAAAGDPESDNDACWQVKEVLSDELKSRVRIVVGNYDAHEIKGIIGECDFFVGSRMHSCIAALSQGVPCVGVAYSMKFAGVFESVGLKDWVVDARNTTCDQAITMVMEHYRARCSIRESLTSKSQIARQRLDEVFGQIVGSEN